MGFGLIRSKKNTYTFNMDNTNPNYSELKGLNVAISQPYFTAYSNNNPVAWILAKLNSNEYKIRTGYCELLTSEDIDYS